MINYHQHNLTESKIMSPKDLAELLNKKFPTGKIEDFNVRRKQFSDNSNSFEYFTLADVLNYASRGNIPPKYLRANIKKISKESLKVDFYEQI